MFAGSNAGFRQCINHSCPFVVESRTRWLEVEKEGNTNNFKPAVDEGQALEEEIRRFLDHVVGPEPENRELLRRILDAY